MSTKRRRLDTAGGTHTPTFLASHDQETSLTQPRERARRLNEQIVRVGRMLRGGDDHQYVFNCQCGCGETIALPLTTFQHTGAWIDGHELR